jgi:subtilisin family serine protease
MGLVGLALLAILATACPSADAAPQANLLRAPHGAPATAANHASNEVIVVFSERASGGERAAIRRAQNTPVKETIPSVPEIQVLAVPRGRSVSAATAALERSALVRSAEPNGLAEPLATIPNDPYFSSQWALNNTGQTPSFVSQSRSTPVPAGTSDADVDAPEAWDITTGNDNVTVAIVDSGIALDHPDIAQNIWHNPGESGAGKETNGIDDDGDGHVDDYRGWDFYGSEDNDPSDEFMHGTFSAGIIGGTANNSLGISGLSPHVRLMAVKAGPPGGGSFLVSDLLQGMAYAGAHGARIVNLSVGGHAEDQNAFSAMVHAFPDVLFVAAAGNEAADNEVVLRPPCTSPEPNVICVAATDQNDHLADFSNWGATSVDLAAPGVDILSTYSAKRLWADEFDTPIAGRWTTGGTNNSWASTTAVRADGTLSDSPGGNYLNNTNSYVERSTDLSGAAGCELVFFAQWNFAANDYAYIEMADGSASPFTWYLTPDVAAYSAIVIPVPPELNGRPDVRFRFRVVSDATGTADGIHIDYAALGCGRVPTYDSQSYVYSDGTSFATPMVSGAAALLAAYRPPATVAQLKKALMDGVDAAPSLAGKTVTGGRLNARRSLDLIGAAIPNTYVRPRGATPTRLSLVPLYVACNPTAANKAHGGPLSYPSCGPPTPAAGTVTLGTPDANGAGANSSGYLLLSAIVGNSATPADEADAKLEMSITDVRKKSDLSDFTGQLTLSLLLRITDKLNVGDPGTTTVIPLKIIFSCAPTASATVGSTCAGTTTLDTLFPGVAVEGARAIWELASVLVMEPGADGTANTSDDRAFARQGVFVP